MDSTHIDGNRNNNSEMEDEVGSCRDGKVCLYETDVGEGFIKKELYDNDKQRSIHNYVTIKDENIDHQMVVGSINERLCDMEYKQGSIGNYVGIKHENIGDINVVLLDTELETDCTDKMCLNVTVINKGYIKQEVYGMKDEQGSIQNYPSIKNEIIDDLNVVVQGTELKTDCIDNKISLYETIISGGYVKDEPCDTGDESGSIHNNVDMKECEECGEEYDLYCLKCTMLIRIFDSNNPDGTPKRTLPKKFVDIYETQSGFSVVAIRAIPKGVTFGPFKGLDSTKDEVITKWKLKNKELDVTKDPEQLNWMQYIRRTDKSSHQNLVPFQYEGRLYYRSEYHLNAGDELLVHWDSKEGEINDMEDSYWEPSVCENLVDSYACTFCCIGYKSINHLKAHNFTCIEKRNKKDFCEEIIQCGICKIYLDKKEYSDYHVDRCYKSNGKCVFNSRCRRNRRRPLHNGDRPFSCTFCPYKATTKSNLKQHIAIHNGDKPFACTFCPYKTTTKSNLKKHIAVHNDHRPFACTLCPYKATTKSNLKQHIAIHNGEKPFTCTLCPYKTTSNCILKRHMAIHNGDKPFACTLCAYKATTNCDLKRHMAVHNDDRPFACTFCPYKATRKSILKEHIAIHNDDKPFACTLCSYKATRKSFLKQHITTHNGNKAFGCTLCPYKTTTKSHLNQHMVVHNDDRPFACTLCPYKTKTKSILKQHIAFHNDDKPFACTFCPYRATTKSHLNQHIVIHNDDKSFACTLCSYKTTRKRSLKLHAAIHNDDKPFACTLCPYKTKTKSVLKQHIAFHNDDKQFACTFCPYKATTKSHLNQHLVIHNGDKSFACSLCSYKTARKRSLKLHVAVHNDDKPFACTLCPYKTSRKSNLKRHIAFHNGDKPFVCTFCPYKATTKSCLKLHIAIHNGDKS